MAYPTNDLTGAQNLVNLVLAIRDAQGQRTALTTQDKDSLVDAINEVVKNLADLADVVANKTQIDDTTVTIGNVWSALKTSNSISEACAALKQELLGGASADWDTFQELVTKIQANASALEILQAAGAGHVKFDGAQSLTADQKAQARSNISAASTDEVADAKKAGTDAMAALNAFKAEVGDPHIDLTSIFNNGVAS